MNHRCLEVRKRVVILLCTVFSLCCTGCGLGEQYSVLPIESSKQEDAEESEQIEIEKEGETKESKTETIQAELAGVEEKSFEYENADWGSMGQQEMNRLTGQWYQLWDDELNSLWSRLSAELDTKRKEKVLEEQRAWIKRKEQNVRGAGAAAFGGSLQPQIENTTAEEMTRARAYILAGYLAEVRNESFIILPEIEESINLAEPNLDEVFEKFEGKWIFDETRGACVGIERTQACAYGVEESNWTVWITGGDIMSDLDLYGYAEDTIIFKLSHNDSDSFYELCFNLDNMLVLSYGTSLTEMDNLIICQ